ncbi:hypothetical protein ACQKDD_15700, partial [Planococcus kocurii]|uniref:hypothetical protein n=1 Tax=Planococcus kocurii TaxID=1374 RepID=UPI003D01ACE8
NSHYTGFGEVLYFLRILPLEPQGLRVMKLIQLIDILSEVHNEEEFEKVQSLKAIRNALSNNYFKVLKNEIQHILLQFVLSLKNHKNQDLRHLAIQILLIMITKLNKEVILTQLSQSMDYDNIYIKNLIINNYIELKKADRNIADLILQKSFTDNHYLVRSIASNICL